MTTITETIPFSFDEVYEYIEEKFEDEGYDVQEGSNTMQLVTAMSYLVSMLNANTASNVNETILSLARKRSMARKDARALGYEIEHIQSYQYELTLEYSTAGTYRINKYDSFTSGDYTYYYLGDTTDSFTVEEGTPVTKTITVKEGTLKTYSDEDTLNITLEEEYDSDTGDYEVQEYVDVPFTDVENDGIEMFLTYFDEEGNFFEFQEWTRSENYMLETDTTLSTEFVRLDLIDYGTPRLYFKFGDIGNDLRVGTLVYINALISSGSEGEMTDTPTDDTGNATVTDYTLSIEGADEESLESIQNNAPLFYNTANRVVTGDDYEAFCNRQPSVETSVIWDGDSEYPTRAGYIWFSFIPSTKTRSITDSADDGYTWALQDAYDTTNWYIEDDEIDDVYSVLDDYKIPTLQFNHRHPIYMDFEYDINIPRYIITTSEGDINEGVFDVINEYFETGDSTSSGAVESFDYEYFHSNLLKRIDTQLTESMGCNVTLTTSINLHEDLVIEETFDEGDTPYQEIRIHLGVPFEGVYTDDVVVFDDLPDITTENFISTRRLYVDETSYAVDSEGVTTYDIKLSEASAENEPTTDDTVGSYRVFDESDSDIEVILYIISASGYTTGIDSSYLEIDTETETYGSTMSVSYESSNLPVIRNTIPRLKTVSFT